MTNKTFIEEAIGGFDEEFPLALVGVSWKIDERDAIKSFLRKHLTQAFIKGVESVGLEKKVENSKYPLRASSGTDDPIAFGYNEYHRKLEEQKQEIIKGLRE